MTKTQQFVLFIFSYIGWFACVFLGKYGYGQLSYLIPSLYLFLFFRFSSLNFIHLKVFVPLFILGIAFDSLALKLGWITLATNSFGWGFAHWLASLWLLFVFSIPLYSLWIGKRFTFAAVLGLLLGPITYSSGTALGVLTIEAKFDLIYYGVFWAAYFPGAIWIFQKWLAKSKAEAPF